MCECVAYACALVVDDDGAILMDVVAILEDAEFRVFTAMHADEALHLRENGDDITVLFTDVQMTGSMDGFGLAQHAASSWPDMTIVVASGHHLVRPGDLPRGGAFIVKPFSAELVYSLLHEVAPDHRKPEKLRDLVR